jgi:YHS domain-containing protein
MGILLRFALLFLLVMLVLRAFGRLLAGLIEGATPPGHRRSGPPDRGVQMVRDPVCGTFLPPASAVSLAERGGAVHYFCSDKCREAYKART